MAVSGSVLTDTERRSLLLALQSVLDYLAANTSHLTLSLSRYNYRMSSQQSTDALTVRTFYRENLSIKLQSPVTSHCTLCQAYVSSD